MGNHNCIIFARAGIKRVHTPLRGNEELALHAVTSHCWNGEEPPRGLDPQGEHGINTARTLYSGWKLNKTPPALAGHVEGWELGQSLREAAPCARGEGSAELKGGGQGTEQRQMWQFWVHTLFGGLCSNEGGEGGEGRYQSDIEPAHSCHLPF